jgi:hypothetical protein
VIGCAVVAARRWLDVQSGCAMVARCAERLRDGD